MTDTLDPACAASWIARGRAPHVAAALADAWQAFPDLPNDAPLDDRIARGRERVAALRPLHEAMTQETEAERQRTNFAFAERAVADGTDDGRYAVVLRARNDHGYAWNEAVTYAEGHHAARAGWSARFHGSERSADIESRRRAYDHGFRDGGGCPEDIFDVARREFAAATRAACTAAQPEATAPARPRPGTWPNPSDEPPPTSWHRRLLVIGQSEVETAAVGILAMLNAIQGARDVKILIADPATGLRAHGEGSTPDIDRILCDGELDDILIAAEDADLDWLDASAHRLPIVRNMERTRNSILQQRAQFRIWLARGRSPGTQFAAGHIRWGKVAAGLSGRLGEFTARYAGPAQPRGHRIVVEDGSGTPALGYRAPDGSALEPEIVISNRSHLRASMTTQLRSFAAGLRF